MQTSEQDGAITRYVEVTFDDIALANRLAHEVLGRTLDELPPQTRRLLSLVSEMVRVQCAAQQIKRSDYRFSRRQVREHTQWGDTQLKLHLMRLVELEYLLVHRGGRGQSFEYELLYDGEGDAQRHLSGLIDVEVLRMTQADAYNAQRSGLDDERSGSGRPLVGEESAGGRDREAFASTEKSSTNRESTSAQPKTQGTRGDASAASYLHPLAAPL